MPFIFCTSVKIYYSYHITKRCKFIYSFHCFTFISSRFILQLMSCVTLQSWSSMMFRGASLLEKVKLTRCAVVNNLCLSYSMQNSCWIANWHSISRFNYLKFCLNSWGLKTLKIVWCRSHKDYTVENNSWEVSREYRIGHTTNKMSVE